MDPLPGWIVVHGWPTAEENSSPVPMLFQVRHLCGVYPRSWDERGTRLLFVNCEHLISESVDEVRALLETAIATHFGVERLREA